MVNQMSDDLISRKALLEEIENFRCSITGLGTEKGLDCYADEYRKSILQIIEDQPSAFDKEKVMNEIKEYKEDAVYWSKKTRENADEFCTYADAYQTCLDIIEKGGLDE